MGVVVLSRIAREFAAEIAYRDWEEVAELGTGGGANSIRLMVTAAVAQVLASCDPNLQVHEFARACGVPAALVESPDGARRSAIGDEIRWDRGRIGRPGPPMGAVESRLASLPVCVRCATDRCPECVDRGLVLESWIRLDLLTCGCGCWTRQMFNLTAPALQWDVPGRKRESDW